MGFYDNYLSRVNSVPSWVKRILDNQTERTVQTIEKVGGLGEDTSVLEIGVGAGVFFQSCRSRGWNYMGVDRNAPMVEGLGMADAICAEVPPLPDEIRSRRFDLIYSAFVLEHMRDGVTACDFVKECRDCLNEQGKMALLVPDALSLKLEFWSVDYTHAFPTTERNVLQIAEDCGLSCKKVIRYRGPYIRGPLLILMRILACFYNYRILIRLFRCEWFFYGIYQMLNQEILLFVFEKNPRAID